MINYSTTDIPSLPDLLTADDLRDFFGVSAGSVYNLLNSTYFPTIQFGRRKYVLKSDLITWLNMHKNTTFYEHAR